MKKPAILIIILFFVLMTIISGCGSKKVKEDVLVVLFDTSGSTQGVRGRYLDDFKEALSIYKDDPNKILIYGDVITENTLATASYPIKQTVEEDKGWLGNPLKRESSKKLVVTQVKKALEQVSAKSDIMTGFQLAEKIFAGHRNARDKRLIIFSDMIEQSSRYQFDVDKLDSNSINDIIAREKEDNRLPELNGVKIWVVGFAAAKKGGLSSGKVQQIQDFWMCYEKATGAEADASRCAARLINF